MLEVSLHLASHEGLEPEQKPFKLLASIYKIYSVFKQNPIVAAIQCMLYTLPDLFGDFPGL